MTFFRFIKYAFTMIVAAFSLAMQVGFYSCASIGSPEGGDYDTIPPRFKASKPLPNTLNFNDKKIELQFDEYIALEKPTEKVIITPPQKKQPVIRAVGKKINVELKDSLIPNTTYTFDFTDAIADNNEKNAIEGFTFAFSTGETLDSLIVSGILLNAENLEPMPNIMIGLHSNLSDTAFTTQPFLRTSQTNDRGRFWIRNVAPGTYRIYALGDMNRNFLFDQPASEAIAFTDTLLTPAFEPAVRQDTIWKDSLTVDSIIPVAYTRFYPDDIHLFLFKEEFDKQYFIKSERPNARQFMLHFNSEKNLSHEIRMLNDEPMNDWYIRELCVDGKSWTYWIRDSLVYQRDTLRLEMTYCADDDSLKELVTQIDTLQLTLRKKEATKDKNTPEKIEMLDIRLTPTGTMDVSDTLKVTFSEPLIYLDTSCIIIQQKIDTLWTDRSFPIARDSLNPRVYYFINQWWGYGQEYRVTVDSASIYSIYEKTNNKFNMQLKTPAEEEYGQLYVAITGNAFQGFGQLLDASDKVVRESRLENGELAFEDLKPGKYYIRYIDDANGNGKWDTGNYAEKRQPETVYYSGKMFDIKKYQEWEENWNVGETPIERQKPDAIKKNKPVEKKPKRNEKNTNATKNQSSGSTIPTIQGMPRF